MTERVSAEGNVRSRTLWPIAEDPWWRFISGTDSVNPDSFSRADSEWTGQSPSSQTLYATEAAFKRGTPTDIGHVKQGGIAGVGFPDEVRCDLEFAVALRLGNKRLVQPDRAPRDEGKRRRGDCRNRGRRADEPVHDHQALPDDFPNFARELA